MGSQPRVWLVPQVHGRNDGFVANTRGIHLVPPERRQVQHVTCTPDAFTARRVTAWTCPRVATHAVLTCSKCHRRAVCPGEQRKSIQVGAHGVDRGEVRDRFVATYNLHRAQTTTSLAGAAVTWNSPTTTPTSMRFQLSPRSTVWYSCISVGYMYGSWPGLYSVTVFSPANTHSRFS